MGADGETALDLGCGTGMLLHALVARGPEARFTGIAPDPQVTDDGTLQSGAERDNTG